MSTSNNPSASFGPNAVFTRRHDLDWLRIIAFSLLIFYHIGMAFNTDGWHVKSSWASSDIEPIMWLSSPWRLPLLFFISGVAIRFLSDKLGAGKFAGDRAVRLLPVILFGAFVIVPPQTWVELVSHDMFDGTIAEFYAEYVRPSVFMGIITPTYNHLWYVVYLLVYSVMLAPLFPALRSLANSTLLAGFGKILERPVLGPFVLILVLVAPFMLIRFTLATQFPTTHALVDDWANHSNSLTILLYGYVFAKNQAFWRAIDRALPMAGILTLVSMIFLFSAYSNWSAVEVNSGLLWTARIDRILYAWVIILTLLGLARRFLTGDGPLRRYLTEAIFPYYILHQTLIVLSAYWVGQMGLSVWGELAVIASITVGGCALGFELVRRVPFLRPVMGLKWARREKAVVAVVGERAG
jgi:glucan biosynthesis protein C